MPFECDFVIKKRLQRNCSLNRQTLILSLIPPPLFISFPSHGFESLSGESRYRKNDKVVGKKQPQIFFFPIPALTQPQLLVEAPIHLQIGLTKKGQAMKLPGQHIESYNNDKREMTQIWSSSIQYLFPLSLYIRLSNPQILVIVLGVTILIQHTNTPK